jgi:hypothetical protein
LRHSWGAERNHENYHRIVIGTALIYLARAFSGLQNVSVSVNDSEVVAVDRYEEIPDFLLEMLKAGTRVEEGDDEE